MTKVRAERAKKNITREIKKLSPEEAENIFTEVKEDVEQRVDEAPEELKPGMTRDGNKIPLNYKYMVDHPEEWGEVVAFTPEVTIPLSINSVRVQCIAGQEMHVPKRFKDIYDNRLKNMRQSPSHLTDQGYQGIVQLGAGSLEPEPTREVSD